MSPEHPSSGTLLLDHQILHQHIVNPIFESLLLTTLPPDLRSVRDTPREGCGEVEGHGDLGVLL